MFFSIITVSLNAEDLIYDTLKSALDQEFTDFEIIVKDGGSTDKTLENIPSDERIRVISKKDKGIYQGMNQAIVEAKGEYLIFMNCGDRFYDSTVLSQAYARLKDRNTPCILYGKMFTEKNGVVSYPSRMKKRFFYNATLCHQASFIPRKAFSDIGYYDEGMKIAADWKFFLEAFLGGVEYEYCDSVFCYFLDGGVSETKKGIEQGEKERRLTKKKYFSTLEKIYIPLIYTKAGRMLISLKNKIKKG